MGDRPLYRDGHHRVFFVYHHKKHKEEDDPKDAVLYFYPPSVDVEEQIALVGGLVGIFNFCSEVLPDTPTLMSLTSTKFAILKTGAFILGLSEDILTPSHVVTSQLQFLWKTFCLFQGSLGAVRQRSGEEGFTKALNQIWNSYFSLCESFSDRLAQAFSVIPYRELPLAKSSVFMQASHILQRARHQAGVLGGVLLSKNRILCSQLGSDLTRRLLVLMPQENNFPCNEIKPGFELPAGVRLLYVYLLPEELESLGPRKRATCTVRKQADEDCNSAQNSGSRTKQRSQADNSSSSRNPSHSLSLVDETSDTYCDTVDELETDRGAATHTSLPDPDSVTDTQSRRSESGADSNRSETRPDTSQENESLPRAASVDRDVLHDKPASLEIKDADSSVHQAFTEKSGSGKAEESTVQDEVRAPGIGSDRLSEKVCTESDVAQERGDNDSGIALPTVDDADVLVKRCKIPATSASGVETSTAMDGGSECVRDFQDTSQEVSGRDRDADGNSHVTGSRDSSVKYQTDQTVHDDVISADVGTVPVEIVCSDGNGDSNSHVTDMKEEGLKTDAGEMGHTDELNTDQDSVHSDADNSEGDGDGNSHMTSAAECSTVNQTAKVNTAEILNTDNTASLPGTTRAESAPVPGTNSRSGGDSQGQSNTGASNKKRKVLPGPLVFSCGDTSSSGDFTVLDNTCDVKQTSITSVMLTGQESENEPVLSPEGDVPSFDPCREGASSVLTLSDELLSPGKERLSFDISLQASESSGSSGQNQVVSGQDQAAQSSRRYSAERSSSDMAQSSESHFTPTRSATMSSDSAGRPQDSNPGSAANDGATEVEDYGGRKPVLLYVQGHMATLMVLVIDDLELANRKTISDLWRSSLAKLAELDFAVSDANGIDTEEMNKSQSPYLYLRYIASTQSVEGTAVQPVTSLANELVSSSILMHDSFHQKPGLQDIMCRTHTTCCYGHKTVSSETFFQVASSKTGGFPDSNDIAFSLDQVADRRLYSDHNAALL